MADSSIHAGNYPNFTKNVAKYSDYSLSFAMGTLLPPITQARLLTSFSPCSSHPQDIPALVGSYQPFESFAKQLQQYGSSVATSIRRCLDFSKGDFFPRSLQSILLIIDRTDARLRHAFSRSLSPLESSLRGGAPPRGAASRHLAYRSPAPSLLDAAALQALVDRSGVSLYHQPPVWGNCGPCSLAYALFGDCTLGSWLRKATIVYARARRGSRIAPGADTFESVLLVAPEIKAFPTDPEQLELLYDSVCVWLGYDTTWISVSFCLLVSAFVRTSIRIQILRGGLSWGDVSDPEPPPIGTPLRDITVRVFFPCPSFLDFALQATIYHDGHGHFNTSEGQSSSALA